MKTLLVEYLPSGATSNTRKLLDCFLKELGHSPDEVVDLVRQRPPIFDTVTLPLYIKRNYAKEPLSDTEQEQFAPFLERVAQIRAADVVVMAYPMYNFSMPGVVKSYFDAVMFYGETFSKEATQPLMHGKKALTLFTSGSEYPSGPTSEEYPHWDALTVLVKICFKFMGFSEVEVVGTSLRDPVQEATHLAETTARIRTLVHQWYS